MFTNDTVDLELGADADQQNMVIDANVPARAEEWILKYCPITQTMFECEPGCEFCPFCSYRMGAMH